MISYQNQATVDLIHFSLRTVPCVHFAQLYKSTCKRCSLFSVGCCAIMIGKTYEKFGHKGGKADRGESPMQLGQP